MVHKSCPNLCARQIVYMEPCVITVYNKNRVSKSCRSLRNSRFSNHVNLSQISYCVLRIVYKMCTYVLEKRVRTVSVYIFEAVLTVSRLKYIVYYCGVYSSMHRVGVVKPKTVTQNYISESSRIFIENLKQIIHSLQVQ